MVRGSGNPADSRNAGQYTAWKRRMSLPMRWTARGQNVALSGPSMGPSADR
jgi:hypothetical protein